MSKKKKKKNKTARKVSQRTDFKKGDVIKWNLDTQDNRFFVVSLLHPGLGYKLLYANERDAAGRRKSYGWLPYSYQGNWFKVD